MCNKCFNGLVIAFNIWQNLNQYVFLCNCRIGQLRVEKYPVWNKSLELKFDIKEALDKPLSLITGALEPPEGSGEDRAPMSKLNDVNDVNVNEW